MKVGHLKQEVLSFKYLLHQKNHEETIKYVQEVIDKFWETLNVMEEDETLMLTNDKPIEEVKMFIEAKESLLDLHKCSLHELFVILEDAWIPKILIAIDKETDHAIIDLGSSVSVLSKKQNDLLNLKNMEKCSVDLVLTKIQLKNH
jgi:hypothetical protein